MLAVIPFPEIAPEVFSVSVFGIELALRWYALAYIVGILLGWRLAVHAVRNRDLWRDGSPVMTPSQIEDLLTWVVAGIILGGRLGYVLFYQPGVYLANPLGILAIWQGGMSFHGGLIGVLVAGLLYTRRHAIARLSTADLLALGVPPGLLLGRVANFINAELWGRPTDLPWAVAFPGALAQACPGIEGLCGRHPSQLYEAGLEGLVLGALLIWLVWVRKALHRPGRVVGVFLAGYGLARGFIELFRQPDAQFASPENPLGYALQLGEAGLTMGQLLCFPMILAGLWLIARSRERG